MEITTDRYGKVTIRCDDTLPELTKAYDELKNLIIAKKKETTQKLIKPQPEKKSASVLCKDEEYSVKDIVDKYCVHDASYEMSAKQLTDVYNQLNDCKLTAQRFGRLMSEYIKSADNTYGIERVQTKVGYYKGLKFKQECYEI